MNVRLRKYKLRRQSCKGYISPLLSSFELTIFILFFSHSVHSHPTIIRQRLKYWRPKYSNINFETENVLFVKKTFEKVTIAYSFQIAREKS